MPGVGVPPRADTDVRSDSVLPDLVQILVLIIYKLNARHDDEEVRLVDDEVMVIDRLDRTTVHPVVDLLVEFIVRRCSTCRSNPTTVHRDGLEKGLLVTMGHVFLTVLCEPHVRNDVE